jgi:hypothetical protein
MLRLKISFANTRTTGIKVSIPYMWNMRTKVASLIIGAVAFGA